jgi:hypothetical protein
MEGQAMIRWTLVGLIATALLAGVGYAVWRHQPDEGQYHVELAAIEHTPPPAHVPESFLSEVRALGQFPTLIDTREDGLLHRLSEAFGRHPWVEKVEEVRKPSPARLHVELSFRTPNAWVVLPGRRVLVDRAGVILPAVRGAEPDLLEIRGANPPSGLPGQGWGDAFVETAAGLASQLMPHRERLQLVAVVIDRDPIQPLLRVQTRKGTQVIWQALNGKPAGDGPSTSTKLKWLEDYRRQHGSLDQPAGPYLLDVRSTAGLLRQPR